jgi:hypothetical protein
MNIDPRLAAAEDLLRATGAAGIDHPGGTLLDHLFRVRAWRDDWAPPPALHLAGLCHAAYGTDGFGVTLLDTTERSTLAGAIGEPAEALVYLYGSCDRASTYPQMGQDVVVVKDRFTGETVTPDLDALRGFAEITAANELDVVRHNADFAERHGAGLLQLVERARGHLSDAALRAWRVPVR